MMTMQMDMTAELAAIPVGLVIAFGVSFAGILLSISREEIREAQISLRSTCDHYRDALRRRHIRTVPALSGARGAH